MKSQLFAMVTLVLSLIVGSIAQANTPKFGYVDMQKAITLTSDGKSAKDKLEKEFKKKQAELKKMEEDLKKMSKDLEKKALVLSDDVKLKKQQELQEEMLKYREIVGKSQLEIQKKERELTLPIVTKLKEVIADIAKKEEYTMILEKSEQSVLWAKDDADLTEKVVKAFEKK
ncbi:MAG: OmpH family outer membrane protein [Bdellovibrionales bacterium]|nr:OmpH family outer membrane protein [Bdellovibrionales bacterium]